MTHTLSLSLSLSPSLSLPSLSLPLSLPPGMKKQISLMEAEVLVGTCPDMCPEKERYRRQDTHRLSWFEIRPNSEPRVKG